MRWWLKLIFGLVVIALLAGLIVRIGSFTLDVLRAYSGGETAETDPMFAEEAPSMVTQPPELEEGSYVPRDHSSEWDTSVQTPVDRTADELGEELRQGDS